MCTSRRRSQTRQAAAASGEPVEALNEKCRADPTWDHEDKDDLAHAAFNGVILQALADIVEDTTIEIALDMSKWFHRMFYAATELWNTGALIPSAASGGLRLALELAMTMGATPASQIAQRFANAMVQKVCEKAVQRVTRARGDRLELNLRASDEHLPKLLHLARDLEEVRRAVRLAEVLRAPCKLRGGSLSDLVRRGEEREVLDDLALLVGSDVEGEA